MVAVNPVDLVAALHGRFFVFQNDTFISRCMALYGEWTENEFDLLRPLLRPGDHVIDAGANIGCMTVPLARAVGPTGSVLAFEPQPGVFRLLAANTLLNNVHNARLFHAGCGAQPDVLLLAELDFGQADNYGALSLQALSTTPHGLQRQVPVVRLDDVFDAPALRLIKIDVEGMEARVVQGAEGIIRQHRPFLYVENENPGETSVAVIEAIVALDYRLYWHFAPLFNPCNFRANPNNLFDNIACVNMFCAPAELETECVLRPVTSATEHPRLGR